MNSNKIRVLAVDDPVMQAYTDPAILAGAPVAVEFDIVPWAGYYQTMMDAFAGKSHYDIVMVAGHLWKHDFIEQGFLSALEPLDDDILPAIAQECSSRGTVYLSPSFCDGHMVVYRKDRVLAAAGSLPETVMTPEQYIALAQALGEGSVAIKADASEVFTDALPFMRMFSGDVYDAQGRCNCADSRVIEGLEQYCRLRQYQAGDTSAWGNAQVAQALAGNQAALGITWSGQLGVVNAAGCVQPQQLGYATLSTAWNVTWSFGLCAASKNQEQSAALLAYLRSPQVDVAVGAHSGAPIRRSSYQLGDEKYSWYRCQLEMIEQHARPLTATVAAGEKNALLYEAVHSAYLGNQSPQQAMEAASTGIKWIENGGIA